MTTRYVVFASVGTAAEVLSTTILALFILGVTHVLPEIPRIFQLHAFEVNALALVLHILALGLAIAALVRARRVTRRLTTVAIMALAEVATLAAYVAISLLALLIFANSCNIEGCSPDRFDATLVLILIAVAAFAAAATLVAVLNRPAPARDAAQRIGLLLLATLPFISIFGLVGTLLLARREASVQPAAERELIDA